MANYQDVLRQPPLYTQGLRALQDYQPPEPLQEETSGILSSIGHTALSGLGILGNVVDTPGAFVRALLRGEVGRAFGGILDPDQRVSGKELGGIEDDPDSWMDDIGGIGLEVATDPLFWLKPITAGGQIVKAAGLTPKATRVVGTGALVKGALQAATESSLRTIAGQSDAARDAILKAAQGTQPGLLSKLTGYSHWGGNKYGDELLDQVKAGLDAAEGAGGIVDEPLRRAFGSGNLWGQATFEAPHEKLVKKLTGQTTPELAGSLDRGWEKFRYGNWLDGIPEGLRRKAAVGAGQVAATPLDENADEVTKAVASAEVKPTGVPPTAVPPTAPLDPESQSVMDRIRSFWGKPTNTGTVPPASPTNGPYSQTTVKQLGPLDQDLRFLERDLPGSLDQSVAPRTVDYTSELEAFNKRLMEGQLPPAQPEKSAVTTTYKPPKPTPSGEPLGQEARALSFLDDLINGTPPSVADDIPVVPDIPAPPPPRQPTILEQMMAEQNRGMKQLEEDALLNPGLPGAKAPAATTGSLDEQIAKLQAKYDRVMQTKTKRGHKKIREELDNLKNQRTFEQNVPVEMPSPKPKGPIITLTEAQKAISPRMDEVASSIEGLTRELGSVNITPERANEIKNALANLEREGARLSNEFYAASAHQRMDLPAAVTDIPKVEGVSTSSVPAAKGGSLASRVRQVLSKEPAVVDEIAADPLKVAAQAEVSPLVRKPGGKEYREMRGDGPLPPGFRELPAELPPEKIGFERKLLNQGDGTPEARAFFNPIESISRFIEKGTRGAGTVAGRSVARTALAAEEAGLDSVRGELAPIILKYLKEVPAEQLADPAFLDEMTDYLESSGALKGSLSGETQKILDDMSGVYARQIDAMKAAGVNITELDDGISYAARRLFELPGGNYTKAYEGAGKFVSPITPNQAGRDAIFKGDLTSKFNKMSRDRRIATAKPTSGKVDNRVGVILDEYKYQNFDREAYNADVANLAKLKKSASTTPKAMQEAMAKVSVHEQKIENAKKLVKWFQDNAQGQYADFAEKTGKAYGMFSSNPVKNLENYVGHSSRAKAAADTLVEGVLPHVVENASKNTVPLEQALASMGMGKGGQATEQALGRVLDGLGMKAADAGKLHVPKAIVQDFARVIKAFSGPEEAAGLVKGIDKFTNFFKVFALMRPAFHGRNLLGGATQNMMHLNSSVKGYKEIKNLVNGSVIEGAKDWTAFAGKNLTDAQATDEIRKLMYQYDVIPKHVGLADDVAGQWDYDVVGSIPGGRGASASFSPIQWFKKARATKGSWKPWEVRGVKGDKTEFIPAKIHEATGNFSEQLNRGVPFIEGLKRGMDPRQLAKDIRDAHVDYSNLSETERQVLRRVFPFWTFFKGQTKFTAKTLAENPAGPLGQTLRAMRVLRGSEMLPEHLAETAAIPLGTNSEGDPRYITGLGLMPEDSLMFLGNALGAIGADKSSLGYQVGGMVNPLAKYPAETIMGRSMFQGGPGGGRELRDMDPVLGRIFSNIFGGDPPKTNAVDGLLMNTIPTPLTMAKQLTDTRKGVLAKASNLLTGTKVTDVPQKLQEAMIRQETQELMRELGGREYSQYFIPEEAYNKLSPESKQRADALKGIVKELQTRAKARAAAKKQEVQ